MIQKPMPWLVNEGDVAPGWEWFWDGLVAGYVMWESGGSRIFDIKRVWNASLSGPSWTIGVSGSALSFNGTTDFVPLGDLPDLDYITIIAGVKANAATRGYILNKSFSLVVVPFSLNVGGNNSPSAIDGMAFYSGSWKNSGLNTDIRGDGKRHIVAGTFDGTDLKYFIDGQLDSSTTEGLGLVLPKNNVSADIGRYAYDNQYFGGLIDFLYILNFGATNQQIARISGDAFAPFRMADVAPWMVPLAVGQTVGTGLLDGLKLQRPRLVA